SFRFKLSVNLPQGANGGKSFRGGDEWQRQKERGSELNAPALAHLGSANKQSPRGGQSVARVHKYEELTIPFAAARWRLRGSQFRKNLVARQKRDLNNRRVNAAIVLNVSKAA